MRERRVRWESTWSFLAKRIEPKSASFKEIREPGDFDKGFEKYDSTISYAVETASKAVSGLMTPKTQKWHSVTFTDEYLAEKYKDYFQHARDVLFRMRYSARSNFSSANLENIASVYGFGSGPFSVYEDYGRGLVYKAWPLKEFFVEADKYGFVDTFFRHFKLNTRQARQAFGKDVPAKIRDEKNLAKEWEFLHCVYPNEDYRTNRKDLRGKKIASHYVSLDTKEIISSGGYDVSPFTYPRYSLMPSSGDPYGYSPAMLIMPEIRVLNTIMADNLAVGNRAASPSLLVSEEDFLDADKIGASDAHIYGGLDSNSQPRVRPLIIPSNIPFAREMILDLRDAIKNGYGLNLLQIIQNNPNMTATEVMQRAQEQSALFSPQAERFEKERFSGQIEKEVEIGYRSNQIDPMPPEIAEALAARQGFFTIEYESPITRSQKAGDGVAIMRTLESVNALAAYDPSIKNEINAKRTLHILSDIWGAPEKIFNSDAEKAVKDATDAQLAQVNTMLAAAPVVAKSAKDLAAAQASGGSVTL